MYLVYIALGWAAGIILAANNRSGSPALPLAWLALALLAAAALWLVRQQYALRWPMIALIALTLGGMRLSLVPVSSDVARYNNSGGLTVEGIVSAEPDVRDDRVLLRIETLILTQSSRTVPTNGLILVEAPPLSEVRYGDRVAVTGLLTTPPEFDTFSYAGYLARSGVFSVMRDAAVQVLSSGHGSPLYAALLDVKARAQQLIGLNLPEPQAGLLTGILLGNQRGIALEVEDAFNVVGAAHIVAISGFNMAVLSSVIMNILTRARVAPRWAALIGITVIGLYTVLVGASGAVIRAAVMSSLLVIGGVIRRKTYVPASLAFVALILSLQNPTVLWDVGFQLSFFATLGLALFVQPLSRWLDRFLARIIATRVSGGVRDFLFEPLVVTTAAQITTLPLVALYFGRFSPASLPVNLLIVPAQAPLLILGITATLAAFVLPALAQIVYWIDMVLLGWTIRIVRAFAGLPFADAALHPDPRLVAAFFMSLIGGAMIHAAQPDWATAFAGILRRRAVVAAAALAAFSLIALTTATLFSRPDGLLHVWMLDVGHSNAVFVQTPGGAHILVDGGRFPSRLLTALGDRMPFTDQEIEILVITQPDENDAGALNAVLDRYDVGVALTHGQPDLSDTFQTLEAKLSAHETVTVRAGHSVEIDDGARLEILHPQRQPDIVDFADEHAVVSRLSFGDVSFLLTGDLSRDAQNALLAAGQWPLATVMQLPKHGAIRSLSEAFLAATQPQVVMLQSDRANRSGDPDADTLALLGNTRLFRTDQGGTIHFWTDGRDLWAQHTQ